MKLCNFYTPISHSLSWYSCSQSRLFTASSCTNPRNKGLADVITGGFIAETYCPQAPQVQYSDIHSTDGGLDNIRGPLDDYNVFVTERLLEISGEGINDFFSRYQVCGH